MMKNNYPLSLITEQVSYALAEDLNSSPDWTSGLVPIDKNIRAIIKTNQDMVLCGTKWVDAAFTICDKNIQIKWYKLDGDKANASENICQVEGNARGILTAERTALNFLQTLSATATLVSKYVELVKSTKVKIMDTRKTIPGLRLAQKYAVTVGGGYNQRIGLYDGVLIKENHIAACGGVTAALSLASSLVPAHIPIQIEVENYEQLVEAINAQAKLILLDNMSIEEISKCVKFVAGIAELEVSGDINLDNVLAYAKTGVDRISIGGLTKNITAIDLSMRVVN